MQDSLCEVAFRALLASVAAAGLSLALPSNAQAQTATATASTTNDQGGDLDTIIVTAQRRQERLQDVPISITSISAADLTNAGNQYISDIQELTPGLRFDFAGSFAQPTIRGVGTALAEPGSGSNVGTYVDGFLSFSPEANDFQLLNVSSIQVLKGPQGTLFGRNTTGGAILIETAKPSAETNAVVDVSYGNFNSQKYQGYFTTGLLDNLAFDVAAVLGKGDGFVHNITNGDDDAGAYQNWSMRTGLLFTPTDDLSFLFRYAHSGTHDPTNLIGNAYVSGGVPQVYARFIPGAIYTANPNQVAYGNEPIGYIAHSDAYQLTSSWDFGPGNLTSYTQSRFATGRTYESEDFDSIPLLNIDIETQSRSVTQEFLATSKPGTKLQWTTGLYWLDTTETWAVPGQISDSPWEPLGGSHSDFRSLAGYLDLTYEVLDNLFLTGGYRYTHDEEVKAYAQVAGTPQFNFRPLKSDKGTPRAVLRYALDPNSSVYVSFAKGFKSAIYNVSADDSTPIEPESLTAYEVGYKYAGRRLSADVSAYHYDYKDLQVESYTTINGIPEGVINNAAAARIWGAEGDVKYEIIQGFSVNVGANYTHATYASYPNSPSLTECLAAACGPAYGLYLDSTTDASGFDMQRSPRLTATAGSTYTTPVAEGKLGLSANFYHTSKFYFDSSNEYQQGAYSTLGLRAEWTDPSSRFSAALYGNNVTNKRYLTQVTASTFGAGAVWAYPATYGVELKYRMH